MCHRLSPVRQSYLFVMLQGSRVKEGHRFCINTDLNVWGPESMHCKSLYSPLCFFITGRTCASMLVEWSGSSREGSLNTLDSAVERAKEVSVRTQETRNPWKFGEEKFDHTFFALSPMLHCAVDPPPALCFKLRNSSLTEARALCMVSSWDQLVHFLSNWTDPKHRNPIVRQSIGQGLMVFKMQGTELFSYLF